MTDNDYQIGYEQAMTDARNELERRGLHEAAEIVAKMPVETTMPPYKPPVSEQ